MKLESFWEHKKYWFVTIPFSERSENDLIQFALFFSGHRKVGGGGGQVYGAGSEPLERSLQFATPATGRLAQTSGVILEQRTTQHRYDEV